MNLSYVLELPLTPLPPPAPRPHGYAVSSSTRFQGNFKSGWVNMYNV